MKLFHIPILGLLIALYVWPLTVRPEMAAAASHEGQETRYIVRQGDSLSKIARQFYQDPSKWKVIFEANKALIKTPAALEVGWSLRIPNLDDLSVSEPQPLQQARPKPEPPATSPAQPQPATVQRPAAPTAEPAPKRTIVARNLYPPFVAQSLQNQGMLTEMIQAVFKAMDYEVDIHFRSLDEGLNAAREGRVTGAFPYTNGPNHQTHFFASQPLYRVLIRAFVRTENPIAFSTLDDLKGLVLCQPEGTSTAELQSLISGDLVKMRRPSSIEACFKALVDNQVDMVVVNEFGGRNALHNLDFGQDVCVLDKAVAIETMHLLFSKVAPQSRIVLYEFDQTLSRLEKNGEFKSITTRHLQSYYQTRPITLQECPAPTPDQAPLSADADTAQSGVTPPPTAPRVAQQTAALPPPSPARETTEADTPKPMKPAVESSFAPVRPVVPQQSTGDLARIAPLAPPHKQVGEFLDFVSPLRPPKHGASSQMLSSA